MKKDKVGSVVNSSIEELNGQLGAQDRLKTDPGTLLYGEGGPLDSLTLLNLLVIVEGRLEEEGFTVSLIDEEALARADGPFRTLQTFTDYVLGRL